MSHSISTVLALVGCAGVAACGENASGLDETVDSVVAPVMTVHTNAVLYVAGDTVHVLVFNFSDSTIVLGSCASLQRFDGSAWVPPPSITCPGAPFPLAPALGLLHTAALQLDLRAGVYRLLLVASFVGSSTMLPEQVRSSKPFRVSEPSGGRR